MQMNIDIRLLWMGCALAGKSQKNMDYRYILIDEMLICIYAY
jgi:hypothetical protein